MFGKKIKEGIFILEDDELAEPVVEPLPVEDELSDSARSTPFAPAPLDDWDPAPMRMGSGSELNSYELVRTSAATTIPTATTTISAIRVALNPPLFRLRR